MSRMETYPTAISLGEESAQMWSLNKRLEAYLSRVKALEEENNLLRAEIHHLKSTRSDKSFIRKYHDEIMTLRDALDDGHREMVQVETDRDSIYQEIEYVKELCLQEKQVQEDVKKELSESKRLLEEEKRAQIWLKERLFQLEQEMEDIFSAHEEEKALMEKEISSYSQRLENFKIVPANFKPVNVEDYANQLSQIWQGAVEEYKNKVSTLEANLTQAKENLKKVVDENKQSQLQLQNLDGDLESLMNRKEMLEGFLAKQWLEQQDEEGRLQLEIEILEKEKEDLRIQIAQVLEDRQQLMHLKMSLSLEVATYRSLLEAESTRLYSPGMDYKLSSSFSDLQLEQNVFRKRHHENTKQLISRDNRANANRKHSAETPSTKRYLNIKSTSTANRTSPVTKEFKKVSSVLQSQDLKYTKASSAKRDTALPPVEGNLRRQPQKGDVFKTSQLETIKSSSQSVTKETLRKDTNIQPVVNGSTYNSSDKELKTIEHIRDFLPLIEKETVSAQVESFLKTEEKHVDINSDFVFKNQYNDVETQNKNNDTLIEKPNEEKIDSEAPLSPGEDFVDIKGEHIMEKHEVLGQIVTCQRLYVEKEELVEPLVHEDFETPIKVNNGEFRKVLDFSKSNTKDLNETNVPTSDGTSDLDIEYSHSQELKFDSQASMNNADVDKEVTNHVVDEEKESLQLNNDLELEETLICVESDLQDEEVTVVQNLQVPSSSKEDNNPLSDDGQNFTKNIYVEQESEIEQYNVHTEKDTDERPQNTKNQENDNEIDHQSSSQGDKIEIDSHNDGKQENTQFDFETQAKFEVFDASESSHLSKVENFRDENKKEEMEHYDEGYKYEENILSTEENIHDYTNIKQTRILVVKEVYQSSNEVMDDLEETQLLSQEEKSNFELSDIEQILQSYDNQQRAEIVEALENIADINQEESEDQKDNAQKERNQLSEESLQPGLEDLKAVSDTEQESQLENKQVVPTLDNEKGDSLLDIQPDSTKEELHEIVHEETVIFNKGKNIQQIEQSNEQPLCVQSTPEHEIQSSEGDGLERDGQSLENNHPVEEENINTILGELKNSELNDGEEDNKDVSEENYVVYAEVGFTKAIKTEVCVQEDYNMVEEAQEIMSQENQLLKNETNVILDEVTGNELEEKSSFHQEVEENQMDFPQEVEKGKEGFHQDVEEYVFHHQEIKEKQEIYHQEIKGEASNLQKVIEVGEGFLREVGQEGFHNEVAQQEGDHQEVEGQVGCEVISTWIESVPSEKDDKCYDLYPKYSNEEQLVGFSLNIIQNNLRFSSENDADGQAEQQEQSSKFSDKETETQKDENNDLEVECEPFKQNSDDMILEEKEKEQEVFETEIICQQSTFLLEHECEDVLGDSKSCVVLAKNLTDNYYFDGSSEKHLTELHAVEAAGDLDYDNSKSEYSMDSQDISICSQKSEEGEISKEYQLEQTLPDTTPLPNLDEFEDLAEDVILTTSEASAEVTKTQSPDNGEAEDVLDSSLESQSSQILSKVSEQSVFFKDFDKDSDINEKQGESHKDLCESENTEYASEPKLDTEDSSAKLDSVNLSAEHSEDLVDSKMDSEKSEFKDPTTSQEKVEASKDPLMKKILSETTFSVDQVQLSSKQLFSESVDEDHSKEQKRIQTLSEDTNTDNALPETFEFVLSSEHSKTELVPDLSHEDTKEMEEYISKEHFDLVTQDFGLEQKQTIDTEDHERDLYKKDTISLPNLDDESENLEDVEVILTSEQPAQITKLQSPVNVGANEVLDSSMETQSSQIFPEVSEPSNLVENDVNQYDYLDPEAESPKDLTESENPGYFIQPKLDTEDCSATLDTKKSCAKASEDNVDSKINEEKFETVEFTSQEEVAVVSPKVEDFEKSKDSQLEETQLVTSSLQDQVILSSEEQVNESVEEDYKEEPKERITLSEDGNSENVITITLDLDPSSEQSETELVYASSHEDTKLNEEYIIKEHSDLITQKCGLEQAENLDTEDHARDFCKEDTTPLPNFTDETENVGDEIILASESPADAGKAEQVLDSNLESQLPQQITEVSEQSISDKDSDNNEQQGESPKDLLEKKNPEQFEEPKLEAEKISETLDTKESATDLSGEFIESKLDDENSKESTMSQEKVDIFSVKVDEFEESKGSQLWNAQFETITSVEQVQLSSEQLVSENVDEDHNEEHEKKSQTLSEDIENVVTETLDFVSSSEYSDLELFPDQCLEDTKEKEENIMEEHSDLVEQDFGSKQTQRVNTEEYERDFGKEDIAPLSNLDDESKNLKNNEILAPEPSAEINKFQSPKNGGESDEVSEQSVILKDDVTDLEYNEHQGESLEDLLGSGNPENLVQQNMDKEDSPATLDTGKPSAEQSGCPIEGRIDDENSESEESTTSQEEVSVFPSKVDELEASKVSELEKTSSEIQAQLSSKQLASGSVEDHNVEPKEKRITVIENADTENVLTKMLDFVPSLERSTTESFPDSQDLKSKQTERVDSKDLEGDFCTNDTTPLLNPENEFENVKTSDILASELSAEVMKTKSPDNEGKAEEVLDSSLESQSSKVLSEASEQSILFKDDDINTNYNEQQGECPEDLLESEHSEHFAAPNLDTKDYSETLDTKNPSAEQSEDTVGNKMDEEKSESEESTTSREELSFFSPKDDAFEVIKDLGLEKTQCEARCSEDQIQLSPEQLVSESVDEDHNEEPEGRGLTLSEYMKTEDVLTETFDFIPSLEHSEMELISSSCLKEKEEHILKEHSDIITQGFIPKQTESTIIKDHERNLCKRATSPLSNPDDEFENLENNEVITSEHSAEVIKLRSPHDSGEADEVLDSSLESQSSQTITEMSEQSILLKDDDRDSDDNEQQGDSPKDLLGIENPEDVVETKLNTEDASVVLDTEKPSAELSEDQLDNKMEDEKSTSEKNTDSELEKTQFETSLEGQIQLPLEQLVSQSVDEDHNEEPEVIGLTLCEDKNKEEGVTEISSEHSETEIITAPCLEDTKVNEKHTMKEHSDFVAEDLKSSNQTDSVNTEYHKKDFWKEDTLLPNLEEEFEILEIDEILASEGSAQVTQLQSPCDDGEADEVLDSSLESQSSQIFPEVSDNSIICKDDEKDYKQCDVPKDVLASENPEHFVEAKLDKEDCSATLDTEKTSVEPCEDPVDSEIDDEKYEKPTTSQEQVADLSPNVDEFEESKHSLLEPSQCETSSENQVQLSSEQLVSESVDKDHNEEPEERRSMPSEVTNTENVLTKSLDFVPSSEQSETELVHVTYHEDAKHSELVTQDFELKQTENIDGEGDMGNFCTEDTKLLSILNNKNLKDNEISASKQSSELTKLQSSTVEGEAKEASDSSLELKSSQVFPDVNEQSILFRDDDKVSAYNDKQRESFKDLLENENSEQYVELKLDTKDCSARHETKEHGSELLEYPEGSKIFHEKFESEEPTTCQKELDVSSPKVDEFEENKDSELEKIQFESSSEDQVQQSLEQLVSENVGEDHKEETEERRLSEGACTENILTEILDYVHSSEHSVTALVPAPGHEDTKEEEEHLIKKHFDLVTQDFILEQKESAKTEDHEKELFKEDATPLPNLDDEPNNLEDDELILESKQSTEVTESQIPDDGVAEEALDSSLESHSSQVLPEVSEQSTLYQDDDIVSDCNEQQGKSPKDLLVIENPEQLVESKLETEDSSAILDAEEPFAKLSDYIVENKMGDEKSKSEELMTSHEEAVIVSPKIETFEANKYFQLEEDQTETTLPEDQVQLSSEQLVNETPKKKSLMLDEDTNTEVLLTKTEFVPSSELSQTELPPTPSHEDSTENEDYTKTEHCNLIKQDVEEVQTENIDTEEHEVDFCRKEERQCDVYLIKDSTNEHSIKSLDELIEDNITSNVPDILMEESKVQDEMTLGTNVEDIKVDVTSSGESSENESVTSDENSPNVSTISYAHEQQDSSDTNSKISKQAEQNDPLLTPEPVPEGSFMEQKEPQTSSDEEKDILSERSDDSFDFNKEHEDISEFTREYSENGKTMNGIFGHTIVQATLDLDDHMFYGHSTKEDHEIIISEAKTIVRLDDGVVNPQSQDKNEDSVIEFTSERKSEGLFQSLFEASDHKESHLAETSEIKNKIDSAAEQSQYTNKLLNPYITERDLDDPSEITPSVMDEFLVNTKQEVNESNQGLKISQQEDSWSSDE